MSDWTSGLFLTLGSKHSRKEKERKRERPFGTAVEQSGLSNFFSNFVACIACFCSLWMEQQWTCGSEEDERPWSYQRQYWRSLSRKRKRYEKTRYDSWKWQCDMCNGRRWKGWNCANCGWEWKAAGQARDSQQTLPTPDTAEEQDTEMLTCNPCQTETMRTEALTTPTPKAAPIGARLDSALARQARARRAYETAQNMLIMAKQRMEEATTELERADAAVENAKKKVGPATGMATDVVTLLSMLKPHINILSTDAAELVARIEGEMKDVKTNHENSMEQKIVEAPEMQLAIPDKQISDAQIIDSQFQAMEAMHMAEEENDDKLRRLKIEAGKFASVTSPFLTESLKNAANSIREQRPEAQMNTSASSSSSTLPPKTTTKTKEVTTEKEVIEEDRDGVTETLKQAIGADWCELEETMKTSIARAVQDRFKPY